MESTDVSCEPMDIDLSSQSVKEIDMDISYNDTDFDVKPLSRPSSRCSVSSIMDQLPRRFSALEKPPVVKKYHINMQKPPRSSRNRIFKILPATIIAFIAIIFYQVHSLNCCNNLDLELFKETIKDKLFGQSSAVELIIDTLELEEKSKLLIFSGGTGVGKSFTSSLLLDSLDSCSNVYHHTMPIFEKTFSSDFMIGFAFCKMSIIIVDDLSVTDMDIRIHIQDVINKSEDLDNDIIVILIYNCNENHDGFEKGCDKSFKTKILNNFSDIKAYKTFVEFKPLTEKHLIKCIKQELGIRKLNDLEFEDLLKNFNVSVDGCKGVHSKMKYLNTV